MNKEERIMKKYRLYLIFMLIACGGAFIWQFCLPQLGGMFTSWGNSIYIITLFIIKKLDD